MSSLPFALATVLRRRRNCLVPLTFSSKISEASDRVSFGLPTEGIVMVVVDYVAKACTDLNEVRRIVLHFLTRFSDPLFTSGRMLEPDAIMYSCLTPSFRYRKRGHRAALANA